VDPDPDADPAPDADPVLDADSALFIRELQDTNKKNIFFLFSFFFLKVHLHHPSKIISHKKVTKQ
jgi:hypothetical protein